MKERLCARCESVVHVLQSFFVARVLVKRDFV